MGWTSQQQETEFVAYTGLRGESSSEVGVGFKLNCTHVSLAEFIDMCGGKHKPTLKTHWADDYK